MMKKTQNNIKTFTIMIISGLLIATFISGCAGGLQDTPVQVPENTITVEIQPTPDLALTEQYLVMGLVEGEFVYLKSEPAGADLAAKLPIGTIGIRPSGKIREVHNQIWIEVDSGGIIGWIQLENLATQTGDLPTDLVALAHQVTAGIRDRDYANLGSLIQPDLCLRFSPYFYLNPDNRILCQNDLEQINSDEIYLWGHYDGTGLPINLTFREYHELFIYDQDYINAPIVGLNTEVSYGNSINNIAEIYPDGMMVEYHFPAIDPKYGGLDWRSLRLVFVNLDGSWYLTAIIHGEWTI